MILDAIDIGGGGIAVDLPCSIDRVDLEENGHHSRVTIIVGNRREGSAFFLSLDPKHAEAMHRAHVKGAHVTLRFSVVPR